MYLAPLTILIFAIAAWGWWQQWRDEKRDAETNARYITDQYQTMTREWSRDINALDSENKRIKDENKRLLAEYAILQRRSERDTAEAASRHSEAIAHPTAQKRNPDPAWKQSDPEQFQAAASLWQKACRQKDEELAVMRADCERSTAEVESASGIARAFQFSLDRANASLEALRLSHGEVQENLKFVRAQRTNLAAQLRIAEEHGQRVAAELEKVTAELQTARAANDSPTDHRFRRLRALILRELHPDHAPAGSTDAALRGEVFKSIWPKMEEIELTS